MKKFAYVLSLLVLLGSMGMASAREVEVVSRGPEVTAVVKFPGMRLVYRHPGIYCWYQGRYYSRADWDRFCRFHHERVVYNRYHQDNDRRPVFNHDR